MKRPNANRRRPQRVTTETRLLRRLTSAGIGKANQRAAFAAARDAYKSGQTLDEYKAALRGSKAAAPWLAILIQLAPIIFAFLQKLFPTPQPPAAA